MVSFAVQQDLSRSSALLPNLAVTSAVPGRTVSGGQTPALAQLTTAGCVGEYDDTPVPLLLGRRGGGDDRNARLEQRTGTSFPTEFCHLSRTNCPVLTGVGARRKKLLGLKAVDVYAVGFYVDQQAIKKNFAQKYGTQTTSVLKDDQQFCDDVITANDVEKTVRIVITSGMVNHDKFLSGLRDSLVPACKKEGDTQSIETFEHLFEGANFRKGLELAFTSTKEGGLAARIDNRDVGEVSSSSFTRAFFGLYLGSQPVSLEAKSDIGSGLASLVAVSNAEQ